jgi:hypothetical protein
VLSAAPRSEIGRYVKGRRDPVKFTSFPGVDPIREHPAGAEGHDTARWDGHLPPGLRISPDAFSFVAQYEGTETSDLHVFSVSKRLSHVVHYALHQALRFRPR